MLNWNIFAKRHQFPVLLETERLLIREFVTGDWQDVHEYAADPEVVTFLHWGPNTTYEETKSFVEGALEAQKECPRNLYDLAIVLQSQNKLIGGAGLRIIFEDVAQAELGYCFNKKFWGNGYAFEACKALIQYGFTNLGLHRIYATCDALNEGSAKVLARLGMRKEGHFLKDKKIKGRFRDTLLFAILAEEAS
jgi:RimJ/RimL family protein N-acetyltransferase